MKTVCLIDLSLLDTTWLLAQSTVMKFNFVYLNMIPVVMYYTTRQEKISHIISICGFSIMVTFIHFHIFCSSSTVLPRVSGTKKKLNTLASTHMIAKKPYVIVAPIETIAIGKTLTTVKTRTATTAIVIPKIVSCETD